MSRAPVSMFLSAGCCGTEWLTVGLARLYGGIVTEHEPIGPLYAPRRFFRSYAEPADILTVPEVAEHVARIESLSAPYVETGWPLFPVLPLLAERIPDRLRIVHLTRHPVPSALSHLARARYAGSPRQDAYTRLGTLGPDDPGVFQPYYAACWDALTPYEKCLFWWTEVHLFGIELPGRLDGVPVLRVRSEDLLAGGRETIEQLLDFIELPWDDGWLADAGSVVDHWRHDADPLVDPLEIHRHPTTAAVAGELGYEISQLNLGQLEAHYSGPPDPAGRRR